MIASSEGHLEMVKLLVENGADVKAKDKDKDGWTALMWASCKRRFRNSQIFSRERSGC